MLARNASAPDWGATSLSRLSQRPNMPLPFVPANQGAGKANVGAAAVTVAQIARTRSMALVIAGQSSTTPAVPWLSVQALAMSARACARVAAEADSTIGS